MEAHILLRHVEDVDEDFADVGPGQLGLGPGECGHDVCGGQGVDDRAVRAVVVVKCALAGASDEHGLHLVISHVESVAVGIPSALTPTSL